MVDPTSQFNELLEHLAEGDLSLFRVLSPAVADVPKSIAAGDLFVSTWAKQVIWYEALEAPERGQVAVRVYSRIFKRGDYDLVKCDRLTARVTRGLFERARAHGFRTVRPSN